MPEEPLLPNLDEIDHVLAFLPKLKELIGKNPEPVELKTDNEGRAFPYIKYGNVGFDLLKILSREPWRKGDYDCELARQTLEDSESLGKANLSIIRNLLCTLTRHEHFCPGSWEDYVNDGTLVVILKRLEAYRKECTS